MLALPEMDVSGVLKSCEIARSDGYWRVQDCEALNDKGHFTDCSELVNTVCEVVELPWICGKSLHDSFSGATVYEAVAA